MSSSPASATRRTHAERLPALLLACALLLVPGAAVAKTTVFIDPGHGGPYSNSNHYGLKEKNVNLALSKELRRQLAAEGFDTGMTRETDRAVSLSDIPTWRYSSTSHRWVYSRDGRVPKWPPTDDLQARADLANNANADMFIAIHCNGAATSRARGTETWAATDDRLGRQLASYVNPAIIRETGMPDRGVHYANFYVIRWANMPSILIEAGFISNPTDARLLRSSSFRRKFCRGIVIGLKHWLATDPYDRIYTRIAATTPGGTAAAASRSGWSEGATSVVLVPAGHPAEGAGAATLARKLDAPILIADGPSLGASTAAEISRLAPDDIVVVGTEDKISAAAAAEAAAAATLAPGAVRRFGGADRYETAAALAEEVGLASGGGRLVITSSVYYSTALNGGWYAAAKRAPVLLTDMGSTISPASQAFINAHRAEITSVVVVGDGSVVPAGALAGLPNVSRVYGADAYAGNTAALRALFGSGTMRPLVVAHTSPLETYAAQALAVRQHRPMLITSGKGFSAYTRLWLTNYHSRVAAWTIVGGTASQPYLMDWLIYKCAR